MKISKVLLGLIFVFSLYVSPGTSSNVLAAETTKLNQKRDP